MQIAFEVPGTVAATLKIVAERCTTAASTHGPLTVEDMFGMLAEDLAMTETRPGSWEAANMMQIFTSHGYSI